MTMKLNHGTKFGILRRNFRHGVSLRVGHASKQCGQAMLELALVLPVLLLLTIGLIEFGRVAYYSIEVSDAARAGAQYGAQSLANAEDQGSITQAALNNAQDIAGLAVNLLPRNCTCPGSGSVAGGCPAAGCSYPLVYVTVTTSYTLNTLFQYPGIPTTFNLTGSSTMPVQRQ